MAFGVPTPAELGPLSVPRLFGASIVYSVLTAAVLVALLSVQLAIGWVGDQIPHRVYR